MPNNTLNLSDQKVNFLIVSESLQKAPTVAQVSAGQAQAQRENDRYAKGFGGGETQEIKFNRLLGDSMDSVDSKNSLQSYDALERFQRLAHWSRSAEGNPERGVIGIAADLPIANTDIDGVAPETQATVDKLPKEAAGSESADPRV